MVKLLLPGIRIVSFALQIDSKSKSDILQVALCQVPSEVDSIEQNIGSQGSSCGLVTGASVEAAVG